MINEAKAENYQRDVLQFNAALAQMSESELARLLDKVEALEEDFQHISLRDGELPEEAAASENLLKSWNREVDRIFLDKQATDAYEQLQNWDNEGGMGDPNPSRRILVRTEGGKRRLIWADIEESRQQALEKQCDHEEVEGNADEA
jgi:hypothetical protein